MLAKVLYFITLILISSMASSIEGPCSNLEYYKEILPELDKLDIKYRTEAETGTKYICYSSQDNRKVEALKEKIYGRQPSNFSVSVNDITERKLVEDAFKNSNIQYSILKYRNDYFFEWEEREDGMAVKILNKAINLDLNQKRNLIKQLIKDSKT